VVYDGLFGTLGTDVSIEPAAPVSRAEEQAACGNDTIIKKVIPG